MGYATTNKKIVKYYQYIGTQESMEKLKQVFVGLGLKVKLQVTDNRLFIEHINGYLDLHPTDYLVHYPVGTFKTFKAKNFRKLFTKIL